MAQKILQLLNEEHYAGNIHWDAIEQWTTPNGEMGLYKSNDTEISRESVWMIIWSFSEPIQKRQIYIHSYDIMSLNVAQIDAQNIARFAGAIKFEKV